MLSSKTLVLEGWLSAKASPFESRPKKKRRIFCETTLSAIRRGTGRWGVSGVLCRPSLRFRTIPPPAPKKEEQAALPDPGLSRKRWTTHQRGFSSTMKEPLRTVESARKKKREGEDLRNTVHVAGNSLGTAGQLWRRTAGHASAQANKCRGSEADS